MNCSIESLQALVRALDLPGYVIGYSDARTPLTDVHYLVPGESHIQINTADPVRTLRSVARTRAQLIDDGVPRAKGHISPRALNAYARDVLRLPGSVWESADGSRYGTPGGCSVAIQDDPLMWLRDSARDIPKWLAAPVVDTERSARAEYQRAVADMVGREVTLCVSSLVDTLRHMADEEPLNEWQDDLYLSGESEPDYQEAAESEGWHGCADGRGYWKRADDDKYYLLSDRFDVYRNIGRLCGVELREILKPEGEPDSLGPVFWSFPEMDLPDTVRDMDIPEFVADFLRDHGVISFRDSVTDDHDSPFELSQVDSWAELCDKERIDTDDYRSEVYEYWVVSDWLSRQLRGQGEKIIDDLCGVGPVWCRTCTGQAISMDYVVCAIYDAQETERNAQRADWDRQSIECQRRAGATMPHAIP